MSDQLGQPKIFVALGVDDEDNVGGEALFANRLRDHQPGQGVYQVDCVPLFSDLHHGDLVVCDESNPEKLPALLSVLERREITTVHLLFTPKPCQEEERRRVDTEVLGGLTKAGFHYERLQGKLFVVNADTARLDELERLLGDFPAGIRWWRD